MTDDEMIERLRERAFGAVRDDWWLGEVADRLDTLQAIVNQLHALVAVAGAGVRVVCGVSCGDER